MYVKNQIAIIGDESFPQHRSTAEADEFPGDLGACHGDHLHRQREAAQLGDLLGGVADADEFLCHRGDDFLAGLGSAATLDHGEGGVDFVSTVDIHRQFFHVVHVEQGNAVSGQASCGDFRGGDGTGDAVFHGGQPVDEEIGCGAGADADDGAFDHVIERTQCGLLLEFVLSHDFAA